MPSTTQLDVVLYLLAAESPSPPPLRGVPATQIDQSDDQFMYTVVAHISVPPGHSPTP